jgi:hypothetical protein
MSPRVTFRSQRAGGTPDAAMLVGVATVMFSALYFLSDLVEFAQGGFSTPQLVFTYVAEAAIPLFVLGLYAMQRPRIGRLGLIGAVGYAYSFISSRARWWLRSRTGRATGTRWSRSSARG